MRQRGAPRSALPLKASRFPRSRYAPTSCPDSLLRSPVSQRHQAAQQAGFTLVELVMSLATTALLIVVLSGLIMAVHRAREHTHGLEDATTQARATLERIRFMISQAGLHEISGQPIQPGLAIVPHRWGVLDMPDVLVVWSGGRQGGLADNGVLDREPLISELIVYGPDPAAPQQLVEFAFPSQTGELSFQASSFDSTILSLLESSAAEKLVLCDRVRVSQLDAYGWFAAATQANVRFQLETTPTAGAIAATSPGSPEWFALPWAQGVVSRLNGLRQTTVQVELQVLTRPPGGPFDDHPDRSLPFYDSVSRRHVYRE